jgi:hypothetical protein
MEQDQAGAGSNTASRFRAMGEDPLSPDGECLDRMDAHDRLSTQDAA